MVLEQANIREIEEQLNRQLGMGSEPIRELKPDNPHAWSAIPKHMQMLIIEMQLLAKDTNTPLVDFIVDEYMDVSLSVTDKDFNARQQYERTHGSILERLKNQLAGQDNQQNDVLQR